MNKDAFLSSLKNNIKNLSDDEKSEILSDYEEHFSAGTEAGKSEEEIAASLGDPALIGKMFLADIAIKRVETRNSFSNIFRLALAIISLSLFNLIFFIPIFFAFIGISAGILGAVSALFVSGIAMMVISVFHPVVNLSFMDSASLISADWIALFFLGLSFSSFGVFFTIVFIKALKLIGILLIKYLKFNIKLLKKDSSTNET